MGLILIMHKYTILIILYTTHVLIPRLWCAIASLTWPYFKIRRAELVLILRNDAFSRLQATELSRDLNIDFLHIILKALRKEILFMVYYGGQSLIQGSFNHLIEQFGLVKCLDKYIFLNIGWNIVKDHEGRLRKYFWLQLNQKKLKDRHRKIAICKTIMSMEDTQVK